VLSGQVDMMFDAVTTMAENIKAGKVRGLATTGRARSSVTADIPTVSEQGVAKYEAVIWLGLMAPAGTPEAIVNRLNTEVNKILNAADVKAAWAKQGAVPMSMTVPAFTKYVAEDVAKWATIVKVSGAKAD
jgi:tripartite-type tricarboxylate transporter receptor subunit TctC